MNKQEFEKVMEMIMDQFEKNTAETYKAYKQACAVNAKVSEIKETKGKADVAFDREMVAFQVMNMIKHEFDKVGA